MPVAPACRRLLPTLLALVVATACAPGEEPPAEAPGETGTEAVAEDAGAGPAAALIELLDGGEAVFGIFAGEKSRAGGEAAMAGQRADFQLYSMERGPFDVATLQAYLDGMVAAGGVDATATFPVVVRTPAIHAAPDAIEGHVRDAMATPIAGITFPHVTTGDEAGRSAELVDRPWPVGPDPQAVNILIVEDREGIANVRDIVGTPGLSVVFAGPGDLRRAYEGDMEAVEDAIQAVLSACLEFDVPCGVTAGADDIAERLDQGFRVIIVTEPEAVQVGMRHAGRATGDGAG
jgi:4-hydroxy-2-oxoheptanedioate aldolase